MRSSPYLLPTFRPYAAALQLGLSLCLALSFVHAQDAQDAQMTQETLMTQEAPTKEVQHQEQAHEANLSYPLSYDEAVALAQDSSAGVRTAQVDLRSAERDLARVQADPLALRVPKLQAEQALRTTEQALVSAQLSAAEDAATSYAAALEADAAVALADLQLDIAETQYDATLIRLEAGAATTLDLERAENVLASAQRARVSALQTRGLAYNSLASLLGIGGTFVLQNAAETSDVPSLQDVLARVPNNALLTQAVQVESLARAQFEAVNNNFSARSSVEAAQVSLENATTRASETRRSVALGARRSYNAVLAAQSQLRSAEAELTTAREDVAAQRLRYEAGSISLLELRETELAQVRSENAAQEASNALRSSLLALELILQGAS